MLCIEDAPKMFVVLLGPKFADIYICEQFPDSSNLELKAPRVILRRML